MGSPRSDCEGFFETKKTDDIAMQKMRASADGGKTVDRHCNMVSDGKGRIVPATEEDARIWQEILDDPTPGQWAEVEA